MSDKPASNGRTDTGPALYEFWLAGLAACTSLTLRRYANRKGWNLSGIAIKLEFTRRDAGSEVVARHINSSAALSAEQQSRLAEITEKTPVTLTVKRGTPIHTTIETGE